MLTTIDTAYSDTRAADLAWALGRQPLPALARLDLELADARVQLRVLGASHQVLLECQGATCSETVACMPGSRTPLPLGVSERLGAVEYEFAARVESMSRGSFSGRAQELLALVAEHPQGIAATFPGAPDAFTALLAHRVGPQVHWRTWHAYPQERRLVATRTRVSVSQREDADRDGAAEDPGGAAEGPGGAAEEAGGAAGETGGRERGGRGAGGREARSQPRAGGRARARSGGPAAGHRNGPEVHSFR